MKMHDIDQTLNMFSIKTGGAAKETVIQLSCTFFDIQGKCHNKLTNSNVIRQSSRNYHNTNETDVWNTNQYQITSWCFPIPRNSKKNWNRKNPYFDGKNVDKLRWNECRLKAFIQTIRCEIFVKWLQSVWK